jgi:hypothetical protein
MTRRTIPMVAAFAALGLSLLAGGCSSPDLSPDVASVGQPSPAAADTPGTTTVPAKDPKEAALDFARCMREHGVEMEDPDISGEGRVAIRIGPGRGGGPADDAALKACQPAMDAAMQQSSKKLDPAEEARMRENALAFARCLRDHGIDVPDPTFDGGVMKGRIAGGPGTDGPDPDSPAFQEAQKACEALLGPGGLMLHRSEPGEGPGAGASTGTAGE